MIEHLWTDGWKQIAINETTCSCCFEETNEYVVCNNESKHPTCLKCVEKYCDATINNPCYKISDRIPCCFVGDCDGHILDIHKTSLGRLMYSDFCLHNSISHILFCIKNQGLEKFEKKIYFLRSDGTFRGLQCSNCGFGPMWNENCSELITHHNQEINSNKINNSCPNCKILVHDVKFMQRWNGHIS